MGELGRQHTPLHLRSQGLCLHFDAFPPPFSFKSSLSCHCEGAVLGEWSALSGSLPKPHPSHLALYPSPFLSN